MKLLKIKLGDDKMYTIRTFSITQQIVMKKEYIKFQELEDEKDNILFELEADGKKKKVNNNWVVKDNLTKKEKDRLATIEQEVIDFMIDVLRKCLSTNHKEFMKDKDQAKDIAVREKTADLVDGEDLRKIVQFAFNGTYVHENNVIVVDLNDPELKEASGDGN